MPWSTVAVHDDYERWITRGGKFQLGICREAAKLTRVFFVDEGGRHVLAQDVGERRERRQDGRLGGLVGPPQAHGGDARLRRPAVEAEAVAQQAAHVAVERLHRAVQPRVDVLLDGRQVDGLADALVVLRRLPLLGQRHERQAQHFAFLVCIHKIAASPLNITRYCPSLELQLLAKSSGEECEAMNLS